MKRGLRCPQYGYRRKKKPEFTSWQYARALAVIGILIFAGCESVTEKCIRAEALIAAYGECATADFKCARAVRIGMYDKEVNQCDAISERE